MKKKVLFSIVGIALFAVAIGLSLNNTQEDNLKVKNIEALAAGYDHIMDASGGGNDGASCECECPDGNGSCEGQNQCDCSSNWVLHCDDVTVYC